MADQQADSPDLDKIKAINDKLDQQLREYSSGSESGSATSQTASAGTFTWKKIFGWAVLLVAALLGPFFVLIRTSTYFYVSHDINGWLALGIGVTATILLLIGYGLYLTLRYNKRFGLNKYIVRGIIVLVTAYTLYGVLYYSSMNTKTDEIQSYYRSLHPIMRVALSTITLADSDIIVTDIQREPEDYAQMGLPENQNSLHYVQSNGYVHAVDLRTKNRPMWKNWVTQLSFEVVGIETLRHTGTADHLHVYLPLNE